MITAQRVPAGTLDNGEPPVEGGSVVSSEFRAARLP